ncbi:hypothetical protein LKF67_1465 [Lactococcus lactis subsp. lactis]|nr:hypothetical protein LKF67_1465 [Lactococcus lactis subsp. lactis]
MRFACFYFHKLLTRLLTSNSLLPSNSDFSVSNFQLKKD